MTFWRRLPYWISRELRSRELAQEIQTHRQMIEDEYVQRGMSPHEARAAALRRLGSSELAASERSREEWGFLRLEALWRDVGFAGHLLRRRWMLSLTAVLTVAIGVGANTAVVSVLDTVLLHPLGLRNTDRILTATLRLEALRMTHADNSAVEYRELRAMRDVFSAVTALEAREWTAQLDGEPTRIVGRAVTRDFFSVFELRPEQGRFFSPGEGNAIVLSFTAWQSRFGGAASAVGRSLVLDGTPYRIIGVAAPGFRFPATAELWVPLELSPGRMADSERGNNMNLAVYARLRDGVDEQQAAARVNQYVAALKNGVRPDDRELVKLAYFIDLEPFAQTVSGDLRRPLWLLWSAALMVVLAGCANVSALLLSQTADRRREIAIRLSLGAARWQILRQLAIESLALAFLGGVAGLAVAALAVSVLSRFALPGRELLALVQVDYRLILYGLISALLCGVAFGIAPALHLLRSSQASSLARAGRKRFQDLFVAAEVCAAMVLLVSTGLLLRSLWAVERIHPGFDANHVSSAYLLKPKGDPGFLHRLDDALRGSPAAQSAALAYPLPMSGSGGLTSLFSIDGREQPERGPDLWHGEAYFVSSPFFDTLRIPLLRGRLLADSDREGAPSVCVIDRNLALRFFPNQDPIGHSISMYSPSARIVGVVASIHDTDPARESRPAVYYSIHQIPFFDQAGIVVRSAAPGEQIIRNAARQAARSAPVFDVRTMNQRIDEALGIRRALAWLITVFGCTCLLLAAVGIAGVAAQMVSERVAEIGLRMALGARPHRILAHFLGRGISSAIAGLAAGVVAATFLERRIESMLYGVAPLDFASFLAASLTVLLVLLPAVLWPAWRASKIDPQRVLRYE